MCEGLFHIPFLWKSQPLSLEAALLPEPSSLWFPIPPFIQVAALGPSLMATVREWGAVLPLTSS